MFHWHCSREHRLHSMTRPPRRRHGRRAPVTLVVPFAPGASNDTFTRAIAAVLSQEIRPALRRRKPARRRRLHRHEPGPARDAGRLHLPRNAERHRLLQAQHEGRLRSVHRHDPARGVRALAERDGRSGDTAGEDRAGVHRPRQEESDTTYYGFTGIGTTQHIPGELFNSLTGLKMRGINYKSSAEAQTDLLAGRLQVMFLTLASVAGQIQGGQLRLLGYTADTSPPTVPKAPTLAEAGVKGMDTPADLVGLLRAQGRARRHSQEVERGHQRSAQGSGRGRIVRQVGREPQCDARSSRRSRRSRTRSRPTPGSSPSSGIKFE